MKKHTLVMLMVGTILLIILFTLSLAIGSYSLSLEEIINIIKGKTGDDISSRVFYQLRFPRTIMGLLTGAALGVGGAVYQTIFRNPLASPDLTGVASGASLGAAVAIVMHLASPLMTIIFAFAGGMISLLCLLLMSYITGLRKLSNFLFAGIIIKCLADAGLMILKTMADTDSQLAAIEFWMMGTLANVTAEKVVLPSIGIIMSLCFILAFTTPVMMLMLADEDAIATGLHPTFWRIVLLSLTTFMVSCVVSLVGAVAFVGLIAPHIALMLIKRRGFAYLIMSVIVGAAMTLFADLFARSASAGAELPLSIPIILLAVPVLLILVYQARGDHDGMDA